MSKENKKAMIKTKLILSCCGSKLYTPFLISNAH